jgi:hypothetical protein
MESTLARRAQAPRMKPLASCLALAFAIGSGSLAAEPARILADHPAMNQMLTRFRPAIDRGYVPPHRNLDAALQYQPMVPPQNPHPTVPAGAIPVTNCNDDGPGSLRDAVNNVAVTGDTIDLTNTGCSSITLTTGDIIAGQTDLTLQGPGAGSLIIDGNGAYSVRHTGSGTFSIFDLGIVNGRKYLDSSTNLNAFGGCVYSAGTVSMSGAYLKYCSAETANPAYSSAGGAIFGQTGVVLSDSTVVLGSAGGTAGYGFGGGIYTPGSAIVAYSQVGFSNATFFGGGLVAANGLTVKYSSIISNQAYAGGGIFASGNSAVTHSTIASNDAFVAGGAYLASGTGSASIIDSTISGNTAALVAGAAVFSTAGTIANSTVAFNQEANSADAKYGAGLYLVGNTALQSTIVAQNSLNNSTYGPLADDAGGSATVTGANNMTQFVVSPLVLPADTLYTDPLLQALAYNGGLTMTHALTIGSPAIDAGNNEAGLSTDQRGPGYPRVLGAAPDIGAFEWDPNDEIFANGFD